MVSQRTTDTHVYFWGGVMSNFYRETGVLFQAPLWRGGPLLPFYHSEGYFMAMKAMMFGATIGHVGTNGAWQESQLEKILREPNPKIAKSHGRDVQGFTDAKWLPEARNFMFRGVWAKFLKNPTLARTLLDTGDRTLVEGSPLDKLWGVGLAWDNPKINDSANWLGKNWLGEVLMVVRGLLAELDEREAHAFDPFTVLDHI
jgi:ribA/ribD-fused uncharacterized protein